MLGDSIFCCGFESGTLDDLKIAASPQSRSDARPRRRAKKLAAIKAKIGYEILESDLMVAIVPRGEYMIEENDNHAAVKKRKPN